MADIGMDDLTLTDRERTSRRTEVALCRAEAALRRIEETLHRAETADVFLTRNFWLGTHKAFAGQILIVDYGSKSLDITLSEVSTEIIENALTVKVLDNICFGEEEEEDQTVFGHHKKERSCRALDIYIQRLAREAIMIDTGCSEDAIRYDDSFCRMADDLKKELLSRSMDISDIFEEYGVDHPKELEGLEFAEISYLGWNVNISYGLILEIYDRTIRPYLDEKLAEMIGRMKRLDIHYMERNQETFRIALIGAFCHFYLVRKQIEDKFVFSSYDRRQQFMILNEAERTNVFSLGEALLASGKASITKVSRYALGLWLYDLSGAGKGASETGASEHRESENREFPKRESVNREYPKRESVNREFPEKESGNRESAPAPGYAIRCGQIIKPDQVYGILGGDGAPQLIYAANDSFENFIINFSDDDKKSRKVTVKAPYLDRLKGAVDSPTHTAAVGFSVDSCGVISLHVRGYDLMIGRSNPKARIIRLARVDELFDISEVKCIGGGE